MPKNVWKMPSKQQWVSYSFASNNVEIRSHEKVETPLYCDVIMSANSSEITGGSIVCSTVCSGADQSKHQSSASLTFVRGIHWFHSQRVSNAENVSIWWRHHGLIIFHTDDILNHEYDRVFFLSPTDSLLTHPYDIQMTYSSLWLKNNSCYLTRMIW